MDLSLFLAQLFGLIYVAVGIGILNNPKRYRAVFDDMMDNGMLLYFGGVISLCVGFTLVTFHNLWLSDWTVLITILGWLALLKGLVLIVCPKCMIEFSQGMLKNLHTIGVGTLIFGLILAYFGFMA